MSADGLAVGGGEGGVGVDEWRPVEQRDVADTGQNFEMLIEVEVAVDPLVLVVVAQRRS